MSLCTGYILADNGYDVWLGNYRGNYYSRNHCDLNPNKNPFWDFRYAIRLSMMVKLSHTYIQENDAVAVSIVSLMTCWI